MSVSLVLADDSALGSSRGTLCGLRGDGADVLYAGFVCGGTVEFGGAMLSLAWSSAT